MSLYSKGQNDREQRKLRQAVFLEGADHVKHCVAPAATVVSALVLLFVGNIVHSSST